MFRAQVYAVIFKNCEVQGTTGYGDIHGYSQPGKEKVSWRRNHFRGHCERGRHIRSLREIMAAQCQGASGWRTGRNRYQQTEARQNDHSQMAR